MFFRQPILVILFCLLPLHLSAEEYFIHLTPKGLLNRNNLLENNLNQILPQAIRQEFRNVHFAGPLKHDKYAQKFQNWLKVRINDVGQSNLLNTLRDQGIISLYEPVNTLRINPITNDSLVQEQWYLYTINVADAWAKTRGSADIIVGVIDTGIDYHHPDLQGSLWINETELYGLDGVDDDNNGFIDDIYGWDFTDAPRFPDGGDYKDPDNDPMDEYGSGHGTQIAGIIAAQSNNRIGISGIAPQVKVMNIRAGTASGYLEEDDVANAILYALDNGARIVNMSFGDVALSRFLKDVIYYAYEKGLIMVTSAGNSGDDQLHYPAGLAETISVGASTSADNRAGFSSYGSTLDLIAPGQDIVSTAIGGKYNTVSGTSFSAPMVSAVAALLLSLNPGYDSERIRHILKTSANDLLFPGWDQFSGAGRLSASRAVNVMDGGVLRLIHPPTHSASAQDHVYLIGTALHPDIQKLEIDYGLGKDPQQWFLVNNFIRRQFLDDTLGVISTLGMEDTLLTIRLRMTTGNSDINELRSLLAIDRTAPHIKNVQMIPLYDGPTRSILIAFETDDICTAKIRVKPAGSDQFTRVKNLDYETRRHRLKINATEFRGEYEFLIEARNGSGLVVVDNNQGQYYQFSLSDHFYWQEFSEVSWQLPAGYFLPQVYDLDHDGQLEVILSRYDENNAFGVVEIYEFENGHFEKRMQTDFVAIPRDAGDVDGDGRSDLLLGFGQKSFLLEAESSTSYPSKIVWADSTNFWAAGYSDLDNDGKGEIVGRVDSVYVVLETIGDNRFSEIGRLGNPTSGSNQFGVPEILVMDFSGDHTEEVAFADYDGDILLYGSEYDNPFRFLTSFRTWHSGDLPLLDGTLWNDEAVIIAASHTSENINYEHEFDARYWTIQQLRYDAHTEEFSETDRLHIYGYQNRKDYDSGLRLHAFNDRLFLFTALFPNLHIFELRQDEIIPVWHRGDARSNQILIADFDGDGMDEFYYNDGSHIKGFTLPGQNRPNRPYPFRASPLDSTRIRLEWGSVAGASSYRIYRGESPGALENIAAITVNQFIDEGRPVDNRYYYAVSAIDSTYPVWESRQSNLDSAQTSIPPRLIDVQVVTDKQVILHMDKTVQLYDDFPLRVLSRRQSQPATSALLLKDKKSLLAGFSEPFAVGLIDTLEIEHLYDWNGVPIDQNYNRITFTYYPSASEPYVISYRIINRFELEIRFSESMSVTALVDVDNYRLYPQGSVTSATISGSANTIVRLELSKDSRIGALGEETYLIMENLYSARGILLEETGKIYLREEISDLREAYVYPQPVKPQHTHVTFAKLPQNTQINIFSINGQLIRNLQQESFFGGIRWNLRDNNDQPLSSGVYLYELVHGTEKKIGKIILVR